MLEIVALPRYPMKKQKGRSPLTCPFVQQWHVENAAHHLHVGFFSNRGGELLLMDSHLFHPSGNEVVLQFPLSKPCHRPFRRLVLSRNAFSQLRNLALVVVWSRHVSHFLSQRRPFTRKITPRAVPLFSVARAGDLESRRFFLTFFLGGSK